MDANSIPPDDFPLLIDRARCADRAAFDRLLEGCLPAVERHVEVRLGAFLRGRIEPRDVVQEACARAWESIPDFRGESRTSFTRWLKTIGERVVLRVARAENRGELFFVEEPADRARIEVTPSRALRREERFERLRAALQELGADQREAVMLVRIRGLKLHEAAERMDRSPNAVMHLVLRGLRQLRERFGDTESLGLPARRLDGSQRGDSDAR